MNLPMVIEAYGARLSMESAHEIAASIISTAKEGVKVKPEELEPEDAGKALRVLQSNLIQVHLDHSNMF
ncbi:mannose/fructose-specific phosphotransferase system component IIA [Clostridium acetobutylicum]|nr:mannose/fructose-specific phosphotransferase system component IIA [Clostridium acetobutylicum]